MRDGVPLPGLSPAEVVRQLTDRVFGALQPNRVWQVLDYHGLRGRPAGTRAEVAATHHVTGGTVASQVRAVRAAGTRLPLSAGLIAAATRQSRPAEDHLGRVRIAETLGLPRPAPPGPATPRIPRVPQSGSSAGPKVTWAAARILAAAGPLDLDTLLMAVDRSRRFRDRTPLLATDLATALTTMGATTGPDGDWAAPPGITAPDRYRVIIDAAADRDLTHAGMIDVLITAGYSRNSATGRIGSSHPLFHRVGPDRYRVINRAAEPAGRTDVINQRVGPFGAERTRRDGTHTRTPRNAVRPERTSEPDLTGTGRTQEPRMMHLGAFTTGRPSYARITAGNRTLDGMALVTRTHKTDDLDGSEVDVSTVHFALDKINYEIDLSSANEARLRDELARFLGAATEVRTQPVPRPGRKPASATTGTRPDKEQSQAIREWARANGYQIGERGRISAAIQEAFNAAH